MAEAFEGRIKESKLIYTACLHDHEAKRVAGAETEKTKFMGKK